MEDNLRADFQLGDWLVKPLSNKLICDSGETRVEPKLMDVLVQLALADGHVVVREDLLKTVWKGVVVNEEALTRAISELRHALGDSASEKRYIRTIPKRGYSLVADVKKIYKAECEMPASSESGNQVSIAVLPFRNISNNPDSEYFSDGLTEELISTLGQISGLDVAASRSVFSLKDSAASVSEIGDTLRVNHLLEGSVHLVQDRLRITTELIEVDNGFQLWTAKYDKKLDDIFRVQEEITQSVVDALKIQLNLKNPNLVSPKTPNLEAYEQYLKGRLKYQTDQPGMEYTGHEELREAIRLAPGFTEAQGLYAFITALNSTSESFDKNKTDIERSFEAALKGNPFQVEALMAKAISVRWQSWDWFAVKSMFEKARAAAPNCTDVMTQFAVRYYRDTCQFAAAEDLLSKAVQLDPINPGPRSSLSFVLRYQKRFEEALEEAERALAINPHYGYANLAKVLAHISMGEFGKADRHVDTIRKFLTDDDVLVMNCIGRIYASSGQHSKSHEFLKSVINLAKQPDGIKYAPLAGWIALLMGDNDEAIRWLQISLDKRISQVLNARAFAHILPNEPLKDANYQRFLSQMNLDDDSIAVLADRVEEFSEVVSSQ